MNTDTTTPSGDASEATSSPPAGYVPIAITEPTPEPARPGPGLPLAATVLAVVAIVFATWFAVVSLPLVIAALVCGTIAHQRRARLWGFGVLGNIIAVAAVILMLVQPLVLLFLTWAFGADLGADPGGVWARFWAMTWDIWLGPLGSGGWGSSGGVTG